MKKSSFIKDGIWLKGNLHTHSTVSDGHLTPEQLVGSYSERGYAFLSLTDHNSFVSHNELDGTLKVFTGTEHDLEYSRDKCIHVVGIGKPGKEDTDYECRKYRACELSDNELTKRMHDDGQFVTVAHPVWSRMEIDEILALDCYDAIEVYNNGTERLGHAGNAEAYWELLLRHGKKIYAMASDDVHGAEDRFGGWICVKAAADTKEAVFDALKSGSFYASTGPEISDFYINDKKAYVECSGCREIHFVSYPPRGHSFYGDEKPLEAAEVELTGRESYIRVVCVDSEGHCAWSQPVFFDNN